MKPHFLQSTAWENYEKLEGATTFFLDEKEFSARLILKSTPVGNYLFAPYGPNLKLSGASNARAETLHSALDSLADFARQHDAIFVRVEPTFPLEEDPAKLNLIKSIDIDPAHTWIIDLTQPEEAILKQMRGSNVQYWRSSAKKGLTIHQTQNPEEITILSSLLRGVANKDHFTPQDETHLKRQLEAGFATLYVAEYQGQNLAASLVYDDADTRFYAHAATSDAERKLAAGTVLLVQMILDAKARGAKVFDFWGVTTSENKSHPWYGFSQYKKSFGGELVTYAGTWDLPVNRSRYRLYQLVRKLNRLKRKVWK